MCCSRPDCTPRGPPNQLAAAKATSLKHMQGVARHPAIECRKQAGLHGPAADELRRRIICTACHRVAADTPLLSSALDTTSLIPQARASHTASLTSPAFEAGAADAGVACSTAPRWCVLCWCRICSTGRRAKPPAAALAATGFKQRCIAGRAAEAQALGLPHDAGDIGTLEAVAAEPQAQLLVEVAAGTST
jgi:hypothetical protein